MVKDPRRVVFDIETTSPFDPSRKLVTRVEHDALASMKPGVFEAIKEEIRDHIQNMVSARISFLKDGSTQVVPYAMGGIVGTTFPIRQETKVDHQQQFEERQKHQFNLIRKRWLKEPIYLVRYVSPKFPLVIKKHLNKLNSQLCQISLEPTTTWGLTTHWANYQAPGVNGKITGYVIDKHHNFQDFPPTLLEDLWAYTHAKWEILDKRYKVFDQSLIKWPI